jgi:hypothetical protein
MFRLFFGLLLIFHLTYALGQQHSIGLGIHSGFTVPYTWDTGMDKDPRYNSRYQLKGAPIGVTFMKDLQGFGFIISPGICTIGQNYDIVNTEGGHDGKRTINMKYAIVPIALKVHLIDLEFFRVGALASITGAFLYGAEDELYHSSTKLFFPTETYPHLPEDYLIQYDGVLSPEVSGLAISEKDDYNSFQLFAGIGLRTDWDVSEHWRVSVDMRMNFGIMEPRNDDYLARIENYESIYDNPGSRKEMFAIVTFGISRFLDFDAGDKDRAKKLKGTRRVPVQKAPKRKAPGKR